MGKKMNAERYLRGVPAKLRTLQSITIGRHDLVQGLLELVEDIDFFLESDDADEEQRRDEKRGLYPQHEDACN